MKDIVRVVTRWALTIHIYLSMSGFLLILLFAVTGVTLNHANFGAEPRVESSATEFPAALEESPSEEAVTRYLREQLKVGSPVTLYKEFPEEIEVVFAGPGSRTHVIVDRASLSASIDSEDRGFLGKINDLHKAHETGRVWFWIVDITAVLLAISSISGLVTLATLPSRRGSGFLVGAIGLIAALVLYIVWVPK